MIKSPLRYPGGKSRAIKFLKDFVPKFDEMREPFFGGGSMTFHYAQEHPNVDFYASEINYDLYCMWQRLKVEPRKLVAEVRRIRTEHTDGKALYREILDRRNDLLSDFQRAVDFFVLNRITFSGVADAGGYSNAAFDKRFTLSSIERLQKAHEIAKKINFYKGDYSQLLNLKTDSQAVFIFLDPPYYTTAKSRLYGKKGSVHALFNHTELFEQLKKCPHKWLLTYDNSEFIKTLYKEFYTIEWELQYGMNNYKKSKAAKGKELLISNYKIGL